jgi:hypothetical protein
MRCFYCGETDKAGSDEHIPSAFLGSRLKTRKVCKPCNERAGKQIDDRIATYLMVNMPKALADVRSVRHLGDEPVVVVDGVVSATGDPVEIRFTSAGRDVRRPDGSVVEETIEVSYGMDSDLWVRFTAKTALGCAAKLFDDDWLDHRTAVGLRDILWHGPIDSTVWPNGVPGWPAELNLDHPVRQALGEHRHLIGLQPADNDPTSSVAIAILFGGQIYCSLPLPDVSVLSTGAVWIIDWQCTEPPKCEDLDQAIERMLRERGWSTAEIDAVRLT